MVLGFRVVRDSVGTQSENEAGQHVVGTITELKGDNFVTVVWDTGQVTETEVGDGRICDLRVFDSGPMGIRHRYVHCEGCDVKHITGTRWRCGVCDDVSLCTPCYHDDSHDTTHPFLRMDFPCEASVKVEKRLASQRGRISGLYPEAEVTRGVHWDYGDQDGGKGTVGKVVDIADHDETSSRSMVTVTWSSSGESRDYRAGYQGKVDLCCRQAAPGADYYYEHLSCVDVAQYRKWHEKADVLKVNDKVYVERLAEARAWLKGKGAWREDMEELAGEVGVIKAISPDGTAEMQLERISVTLDTSFLEKLLCHTVGDVVRVIDQKEMLQRFQKKHGGWDDAMDKAMGKLGVVKVIDTDGDVAVKVGNASFVFHPACLIPSPTEMIPRLQPESRDRETTHGTHNTTPPKSSKHRPEPDSATPEFLQSFGGLAFLQAMAMGQAMGKPMDQARGQAMNQAMNQAMGQAMHERAFVTAILENNCTVVTGMLKQYPELKNLRLAEIPVLSIAAHQGHTGVIGILLDAGASIDVSDANQNTPLNVALVERKGDAARVLIERGANVKLRNSVKHTPLHIAANFNMYGVVKLLLEKGSELNAKELKMNTPLHLAIMNKHDESAAMLIGHPDVDIWLKNDNQMNALAFACFIGHELSVEKLIAKEPSLVNSVLTKGPDGYFPIHITAGNNHLAEARLLLEKGRAKVNVPNVNGITPLHLAAAEGYYAMADLLLTHGADISAKDLLGNTPLHVCMIGQRNIVMVLAGVRDAGEDEERIKIAKLLIQHNASVDAVNNMGMSPMHGCCVPKIKDAVAAFIRSR